VAAAGCNSCTVCLHAERGPARPRSTTNEEGRSARRFSSTRLPLCGFAMRTARHSASGGLRSSRSLTLRYSSTVSSPPPPL
jgi:hypothetical protein